MQVSIQLPFAVAAALSQCPRCFPPAHPLVQQRRQFGPQLSLGPDRGGSRRRPPQHQGAFALGCDPPKVLQCRAHRRSDLFFMAFGQLPGDPQRPVPQGGVQVLEQLQQPVRRFEQHHGARFIPQFGQSGPPLGSLGRQKSLKAEPFRRKATADQGGGHSTGAWDADHPMPGVADGSYQGFAGIRDARQTCIADHGHSLACGQGGQQFGDAVGLVVLMKAHQPGDLVALAQTQLVQQQPTAACVLAGDQAHPGQQLPRPGREIAQIADRGSH